jgi:hypothetical protein
MGQFTVRVVLHDAADEDNIYLQLHMAMGVEGFSRSILSSTGVRYKLPPAEYYIESSLDKCAILEKAKRAARTTLHKHSVFVTPSDGAVWYGLEEAAPLPPLPIRFLPKPTIR